MEDRRSLLDRAQDKRKRHGQFARPIMSRLVVVSSLTANTSVDDLGSKCLTFP